MIKQIIFAIILLITLSVFAYTAFRYYRFFRLTKPFPIHNWGKRIVVMFQVAFVQTRILRKPVTGMMHALVWWGFLIILIGSVDMVIDGLFGTERALSCLGPVYSIITASGDIFALIIHETYLSPGCQPGSYSHTFADGLPAGYEYFLFIGCACGRA